MKLVFNLNEIEGMPAFSPPHHTESKDRKMVDETIGAKHLSIWHGEIGPGGIAELHFHEEMEQAFLILDGEAIFQLGEEEHRLGSDNLVFVPAKKPHRVTPVGDVPLKLLMIQTPPPVSFDIWKKKAEE